MNALEVKTELRCVARAEKAEVLLRFFKTGKGQYGEGDRFLGVMVPEQRKVAKKFFTDGEARSCRAVLSVVRELLESEFHEDRLTALLILVDQCKRSGPEDQKRIVDFYLKNLPRINNWDLVDLSAPNIVGAYLLDKDPSMLFTLAESGHLWTRRVAVLATLAFIKAGRFAETLSLSERLLIEKKDSHDLMHKAVGWMLREVGKRDRQVLEAFLDRHAAQLPRTALRYAIERFPETERHRYLAAGK
jgi:3-methyladenine DNA glycosylase AlkD